MTSLATGSIVYYKTENPYFIVASMTMTSIIPYTIAFIAPINRTLFAVLDTHDYDLQKGQKSGQTVVARDTDFELDQLFIKWDLLHFGRTVLSFVALAVALYGSFSSKAISSK
ncbi:hypothetical protein BX616_000499 [Lobosporangium transversale]|nr:hypothetical protein BX616_000499 [Lobosporangium transversale]